MGVATNRESLTALPSFGRVKEVFGGAIDVPTVPVDLAPVVRDVSAWDERARRHWASYERDSVFARSFGIGVAIADAIRLQRAVRTRRIDEWLAAAPAEDVARFEAWRDAFFARCDALAALGTAGLVASGLSMPDDGVLSMAVHNPARLGGLIGGRRSVLATLSVYAATILLLIREWVFFRAFVVRQLRRMGVPLSSRKARDATRRLNESAGRLLLTHRHAEILLGAYTALEERGVSGADADRLVLRALEFGHKTSGKPWKGLSRLVDLAVYSGVDPKTMEWDSVFDTTYAAPVDYTHVPGREWIVRDYQLGKHLMQIDGKIAPGDRWAGLQQGRGSLSTGYLRGGHERVAFGRRYSKSLAAFLDSMVVAEGTDHQRLRKAFLPFFTQAAVLSQAQFVEQTVTELLDHATGVARRNGGAFDLRNDFAYLFPVRVICHVLELPAEDVPSVQHWAEASVRSMDTEAGLSLAVSREGQRAADELREYLERKLESARSGTFGGHVIGDVARDESLSEAERVANLGVVIFAGFETTTGLISKGMEALLRHPEQWRYLRDAMVQATPVMVDGTLIQIWNGAGWRGPLGSRRGTWTWRAAIAGRPSRNARPRPPRDSRRSARRRRYSSARSRSCCAGRRPGLSCR